MAGQKNAALLATATANRSLKIAMCGNNGTDFHVTHVCRCDICCHLPRRLRHHCFPSCLRNREGVKRTFFGRKSQGRKAGSKISIPFLGFL